MPEYRLYKLDRGGHIDEPAAILDRNDDEAAISEAKLLLDGADLQLWQGSRLVITLNSPNPKW